MVRIVTELANPIRGEHREDAVIVLTGDCGFPGQDLLAAFEKLGIFHAFGARVTENVRKAAASPTDGNFGELRKEKQAWRLADFGLIYGTWSVFRRLVFRQPLCRDGQMPLSPDRAETPIVTNIRSDTVAEDMPEEVRRLTDPAETPALCHGRGAAEPVFRSLRDFGFEETPLRRFAPDNALCYMMLAAFPLFEAFREDILSPVIPAESHAGTVRREFADIAAKIVSHANQIKLRFASAVFRRLNLSKIWDACKSPPRLC